MSPIKDPPRGQRRNMNDANVTPPGDRTFVELVLDATGSMGPHIAAVKSGYTRFITDQLEDPSECYVSLTKFVNACLFYSPMVERMLRENMSWSR